MTFARPEFLWLLLLGVPVAVLHLVRRRRKRLRVPALLLWERVLARAPRRFGARRLASLLSLLLLLLAVAAGSLAAADPRTGRPAPRPRPLLLCLCGSARMGGERFRRALALAREEIRRKAPVDPVTVLLVSEHPRILAARETDPGRVEAALAAARPSLARADWPVIREAAAAVRREGGRVAAVGVDPEVPSGVAVLPVPGENAGITGFGVHVGREKVSLRVTIAGAGPGTFLRILLGGREVRRRPARPEVRVEIPRGEGGLLRAVLDPGAGPAFDDRVEAWIPPSPRLRIGVVAEGGPDPFLRAALSALAPLVDPEDSVLVPPARLREAGRRLDVLVVAGAVPDPLPPGDYVLLTPPPVSLGFTPLPEVGTGSVWRREEDHPVLRGVDAAEVGIAGARPARLPEGARALLSVPEGAVAAVGEKEGRRYVWIGLRPENSTLPLTAAWPLLLRNAFRWFAGMRASVLPPAVPLGEAVTPSTLLPPGVRAVACEGPGGEGPRVVAVRNGRFSYRPAVLAEGEVRARLGAREYRTRINALLPGETNARPRGGAPSLGPDRSHLTDTERRLAPWFAAAAALLLLAEQLLRRRLRP